METIQFGTQIWTGDNALAGLEKIDSQRIFLVTDPFMVKSGALDQITKHLNVKNELSIFSDIQPDPPITKVVEGIKALQSFKATLLVAVGGGSAIDAAKAMKYFAQKMAEDSPQLDLIAIPTTSGTGSEVTNFAVITNAEKGVKYPLVTDDILPKVAVLDANLVLSAPQNITVDTGMDVLTHCLEAYVSINANDFSDALAEKGFQMVFEYLPRVSENGDDMEARQKMHDASCIAGMAFNMVNLGLNHGIAHAAGARYHIPHGRLNTILMPNIIAYNAEMNDGFWKEPNRAATKYANLARLININAANPKLAVQGLIDNIICLRKVLKMPASFSEYGISKDLFESTKAEISAAALKDGTTVANPRKPTVADVTDILNRSFM
ncbi:Alcohol dehydrogenase [Furfurilactobacillus rossiae]|uniref:1-propanol dehydrogenase PduQ n=1 Tax=Furfurilactobacillus rossiae TaxID=231049 RepID=UPI0015B94D85|nr:1-propanol dehydrogenase PduQ [Furfurilactobacillus rossiae]MCF6166618.1 iron-containing alcohol dehydrogenase [Furfurilactobacillus rossiae]QLE64366.1 Alcohol dehydrogenase [Furfurilactobacillus rossiae]